MRIYLVLLVIFGSCATQRKAEKFYDKHPEKLAEKCATEFPVKDSIIKGDSVILFDTLWETFTDTLISEPQVVTEIKTVPKIVTKTVVVRDTIIRENTAKVSVLGSQIAKLNEANQALNTKTHELTGERDTFKHERNKWKLRFFLLLFGVGLAYALKVKMTKKLF